MKNLRLFPISIDDIEILDLTEYNNLSMESRKLLVADSEKGLCKSEFFRFYLIKNKNETVGVINMYGHGTDTISVAPEIFEKFRNKGFAIESLNIAYEIAKGLGFNKVIAGIREENVASQKLHEKLGFLFIEDFTSKNGKKMKRYFKNL